MAKEVESTAEKDAFKEYYVNLLEVLPMNLLGSTLYSKKLLSEDHKKRIDHLSTQKQKAQYLLDHVVNPGLNVGYTKLFAEMIEIMESSDDPVVKHVAEKIKMFMADSTSADRERASPTGTTMHNYFVYHGTTNLSN